MPKFDVSLTLRLSCTVEIDATSPEDAERIANERFAQGEFADKDGWDLYDTGSRGKSGWASEEARAVSDFQVGWIEPRPDPVSATPSNYDW